MNAKRLLYPLLPLALAGVLLLVWWAPREGRGPERSGAPILAHTPALQPASSGSSAAALRPIAQQAEASAVQRWPAGGRPDERAEEPDPYVEAEVQSAGPVQDLGEGKTRTVKVVRLREGAKYPFLRVEETVGIERASGLRRVLARTVLVADHVLVRLKPGSTVKDLEALNVKFGAQVQRRLRAPGTETYVVRLAAHNLESVADAVAAFRQAATTVAYAEPDYVVRAIINPDDTRFSEQWALQNTGQTGGTSDADIDAPEAWAITTGSGSVKVGILDTGIDYTHPDLAPNLGTNPGEIPGNGLDDDGNGYADDVRGWDFANNDNNPTDDHFHGTHVAGSVGARGNNGMGVSGVCWNVTLVPLKFLDASGSGYLSDAVEAIYYATLSGVNLTSNSWGGGGYSQALKDAIDNANTQGVLFVAAAGNAASNNDTAPFYPASYSSPNVLAVAATDHRDALAWFSNVGATSVHLAAPGVGILNTFPTYLTGEMTARGLPTHYASISGTSMATPHVSGAAALLWSFAPSLTAAQVKQRLLERVDPIPGLFGKTVAGGRLNLFHLLNSGWTPRPAQVVMTSMSLSDASGNGNGYPEPNETVTLSPTLANLGQAAAAGVNATLTSSSPYATILDGVEAVGGVPAMGQVTRIGAFRVKIAAVVPLDTRLDFTVTVTDGSGRQTSAPYACFVAVPRPQAHVEIDFAVGEILADHARDLV